MAAEGGQEIITSVYGERDELSFYETSGYWEVPLSGATSIVAAPWVEQNYDTEEGWRGEGVVGVKRAIFADETFAAAVSGSAFWSSHPGPECGEGGGELRIMAGASRREAARAFVNFEVAAHMLDGGCAGQDADLTVGFRPTERWLVMGQVFAQTEDHREDLVRAQVTFVRFGEDRTRGVQIGVRARLDGEDAEPAVVLGLWGRPGDTIF
jgi:hypothetical protein